MKEGKMTEQNALNLEFEKSWKGAKAEVLNMKFPSGMDGFKESQSVTGHQAGKQHHPVKHYTAELGHVHGFNLDASYTICEECSERVVSQKFLLFNDQENTVFIRELVSKSDNFTRNKY